MDQQQIIERIEYFRKQARLTQKELSQKIGKNPCYVNRLETGIAALSSLEVLFAIIDACGVTEEEFFFDDYRNYKKTKSILEELSQLPPNQRNVAAAALPMLMDTFTKLNQMGVMLSDEDKSTAQGFVKNKK